MKRFLASGHCGWYLRVVTEGDLGSGDRWELLSRDPAGVSIAELIGVYRGGALDRERLAVASGLKALPGPPGRAGGAADA
jgi:MOSC domain-containing protein YiiM